MLSLSAVRLSAISITTFHVTMAESSCISIGAISIHRVRVFGPSPRKRRRLNQENVDLPFYIFGGPNNSSGICPRSYTARQFLDCSRLFVARRGQPEHISDNAPQFKLTKIAFDHHRPPTLIMLQAPFFEAMVSTRPLI